MSWKSQKCEHPYQEAEGRELLSTKSRLTMMMEVRLETRDKGNEHELHRIQRVSSKLQRYLLSKISSPLSTQKEELVAGQGESEYPINSPRIPQFIRC
jgi:hypothetical protein